MAPVNAVERTMNTRRYASVRKPAQIASTTMMIVGRVSSTGTPTSVRIMMAKQMPNAVPVRKMPKL